MTVEQIQVLTKTLEAKVAEGLEKLKDTPIESQSYHIVLNNIITSTTLANKIRLDNTELQTEGAA